MYRQWTWLRYLVIGGLTGLGAWGLLVLDLFGLGSTPLVPIGVPLLLFVAVPVTRVLAGVERARAARLLGAPVAASYRPAHGRLLARYGAVLADPANWRDLTWLWLHSLYAPIAAVLAVGLWIGAILTALTPLGRVVIPQVVLNFSPYGLPIDRMSRALWAVPIGLGYAVLALLLPRPLAVFEARLARWLLAPTERARLTQRVDDLTASRRQTLDARAAELGRIERDLHDGAQARLVSLSISLGLAEEAVRNDPDAAARLLAEARGSAGEALTELRDLVRGIHPPVLADRGLVGALQALALQCAVPVEVDLAPLDRLPAPVESALYFTAAEVLTNVAKHSGATHAALVLIRTDGLLQLEIRDNGHGGAGPAKGRGLAGIAGRIGAFDGRLTLTSPPGGPTVVRVELPCGS
jgi:signal transduction histidine kinase